MEDRLEKLLLGPFLITLTHLVFKKISLFLERKRNTLIWMKVKAFSYCDVQESFFRYCVHPDGASKSKSVHDYSNNNNNNWELPGNKMLAVA